MYFTLKMKSAITFTDLVRMNQSTRRQILEDKSSYVPPRRSKISPEVSIKIVKKKGGGEINFLT